MKLKIKSTTIILTLLVLGLGITGAYGSWHYLVGGINGDSDTVNPGINEFEYPEWTVNFYSLTSSTKNLLATHTYTYQNESWTFPDNTGTKYPDQTFKLWSPTMIYYGGAEKVYELADFTRVDTANYSGKIYYSGNSYKPTDIEWNSNNTLDLFEITEEATFSVANDPELVTVASCNSLSFATQHPASTMPYNLPAYQPYLRFATSACAPNFQTGTTNNNYSFIQFLPSGFETKANPDVNEKTIPFSIESDNTPYRIIKEIPELTGTRVTEDARRDTGFVDSTTKTVNYYLMEDPIIMHLTPGAYLSVTSGPSLYNPKTLRDYDSDTTSKHADDTFGHKVIPQLIQCGDYPSVNNVSLRFDHVDCANFTHDITISEATSESEAVIVTATYLDITVRWDYFYEYVAKECNNPDHCLVKGTPILKADGTYVPVENIKPGDEVVVFNHETGKIDTAPITFNDTEPLDEYEVIYLEFSNGDTIGIVDEHGYFDLDLNKYVYFNANNYQDYIGHNFYSLNGVKTKLLKAYKTLENTELYSPVSYYHLNYFTGSLLSMPGGIEGLFNIFEYEENSLKYNEMQKQKDIEEYGLFTYEDFKDYASLEMFNAFPTPYLKVSIGKGLISMERIMYLINRYASKVN